MLSFAGCAPVAGAPSAHAATTFGAASHVLTTAASARAVALAVEQVAQRHRENHPRQAGVSFDVLGGAVTDLAPADTAFPYRHALAVAQYTVGWPIGQRQSEVRARPPLAARLPGRDEPRRRQRGLRQLRRPDAHRLAARLLRRQLPAAAAGEAARYDPDEVFRFPQSVQPAG